MDEAFVGNEALCLLQQHALRVSSNNAVIQQKLYELYTVPQIRKKTNKKKTNKQKSSNTIVKDSLIVKKARGWLPFTRGKIHYLQINRTN